MPLARDQADEMRAKTTIDTLVMLAAGAALLLWAAPVRGTIATFDWSFRHLDARAFRTGLTVPGAGVEVLPTFIREAAALVREANVDHYRLSPRAAESDWFVQQVQVLAWPHTQSEDPASPVILLREPVPAGCAVVARTEDVVLARCP
ncbi:MAG TPA: hypothetical protein VGH20_04370 [Myxococcales bacterium]|jgi:hypothetical protein